MEAASEMEARARGEWYAYQAWVVTTWLLFIMNVRDSAAKGPVRHWANPG